MLLPLHVLATLLKGLFRTLLGHLTVEPLSIFTVVVDHVVVSNPFHLPRLAVTQLAVYGRAPPVSCGSGSALHNANWPAPPACSCPEPAESSGERCAVPINLNQSTSSCPVIGVPYARINSHCFLVGIRNPHAFIVGEDSDRKSVDEPPGESIERDRHLRLATTMTEAHN